MPATRDYAWNGTVTWPSGIAFVRAARFVKSVDHEDGTLDTDSNKNAMHPFVKKTEERITVTCYKASDTTPWDLVGTKVSLSNVKFAGSTTPKSGSAYVVNVSEPINYSDNEYVEIEMVVDGILSGGT